MDLVSNTTIDSQLFSWRALGFGRVFETPAKQPESKRKDRTPLFRLITHANVHHRGWHVQSFGADQLFNVLAVGALLCVRVFRTNPGINIEVEAADRGVPRGVVLV